ncbi:MAG TPA: hypothetical protein VNR38_00980 [Ureibacillus sp.]|nr:hypothetical protein [Ureibacillus sp.]
MDKTEIGLQVANAIFRQLQLDNNHRIVAWIYNVKGYPNMFRIAFTDGTDAVATLGACLESVIEISY